MIEKVEIVKSTKGNLLYGIAHIPDAEKKLGKIAVNLLNPGIKYRVAPNRLNVKIARALCSLGYLVFRFDPEGIGDSEGDLPDNILVPDIFETIQKGHLVQSIIEINRYIIENYEIQRLILIGNCGGAITALMVSSQDPSVYKLCLIDTPINLRTSRMSFADKVVEGGNRSEILFKTYIKKLYSFEAWKRLFLKQSDFKAIRKLLGFRLKKLTLKDKCETKTCNEIQSLCDKGILNEYFFSCFDHTMNEEIPILFILAGNDSGTEFFLTYFQNSYLQETVSQEKREKLVDIFTIENANHVYSQIEWQKALINKICYWIK